MIFLSVFMCNHILRHLQPADGRRVKLNVYTVFLYKQYSEVCVKKKTKTLQQIILIYKKLLVFKHVTLDPAASQSV